MTRKRSSRASTDPRAGFSLVELLVTLALAGITLVSAVNLFTTHVRTLRGSAFRLEAHQALRGSLDAITRDVRLAGACLPREGQFVALAGTNAPGGDAITARTGVVRDDLSCITTATMLLASAGTSTLQVADPDGFAVDMLAYVRHPNGSGDFSLITAVGGTSVGLGDVLSQDYPAGSGVYAVDERTYALDASPAVPELHLTVDRGVTSEFAIGVRDLQVRYVLDRNCPPCDEVDIPSTTAEWWLVAGVEVQAWVETVGATRAEDQQTLVATSMVNPRNLLQ